MNQTNSKSNPIPEWEKWKQKFDPWKELSEQEQAERKLYDTIAEAKRPDSTIAGLFILHPLLAEISRLHGLLPVPAPFYDPNFGDDRFCECGHTYYRHFDSYENMAPVGCKYCGHGDRWVYRYACGGFKEATPEVIKGWLKQKFQCPECSFPVEKEGQFCGECMNKVG